MRNQQALIAILVLGSVAALLSGCGSEDTLSNTVKPVAPRKYVNPNNGQNPMGKNNPPATAPGN